MAIKYEFFAQCIKGGDTVQLAALRANIEVKQFKKPADYYVYILVDPRNQRPFYIGKGKGNRARVHLYIWHKGLGNSRKNAVISAIVSERLKPLIFCVCEGVSERTALSIENIIIRSIGFSNLTNLLTPEDDLVRAKSLARWALHRFIHPDRIPRHEHKMYWKIFCELAEILSMKHAYH